jgi:hypothetical protein
VIGRRVVMTTIATPLAGAHGRVRAQTQGRIARVGWLAGEGSRVGSPPFVDALREQDDRVIE